MSRAGGRARRVRPGGDDETILRAARSVSRQITIGAAVIVALIVLVSVVFVINQSQPKELLERPEPGQTKIYVDSYEVLIALGVVGIGAIIVAGVLSWVVARRAVAPLGAALRMQRTFVADASHELRTPLAVLDAHIQILQRRLGPGHELAAEAAAVRADSRALIEVVDDLLLLAAAEEPDQAEATDVAAVLTDTVQALRVLGEERGIALELDAPGGVRAAVPGSSIRRCVVALIDNALAHSPDDATIGVRLAPAKTTFTITVTDHGPGVQGIAPGRIFDRFAHADAAPSDPARRRSYGIGLSLVREIAARGGGSVELRETSAAGTTIAITLPRA
ncbi:hypothetical protein GCM10022240_29230 [Microbacterium kribbense]|uniref:histidine kinase n=1 Tax=Microbacterium kribbense TaxID=433645 RepID=A0ABP7GUL4_9MICO